MQKKLLLLALAFVLLMPFTFGQNAAPVVHTEGIVVLKAYDPAVPSIVTDIRGQFVFTRYDAKGQLASALWKYDPASGRWVSADQEHAKNGGLSLITGKTDPVVPPGSMVRAVYWKDASGTLWCLSGTGVDLIRPDALEELWAGNDHIIQTTDEQGKAIWTSKFSIGLHEE